jgi:predicted dehydrogenase
MWRSRLRNAVRVPVYGAVSPYKKTFYVLIRKYLSFIAGLAPEPPVTPEEGLQAIKILEAARRSIESGESEMVAGPS